MCTSSFGFEYRPPYCCAARYHQIPVGASKLETPESESGTDPVQLIITVERNGKRQLRAKSGKCEDRNERLSAKWRSFRRDEHEFCGINSVDHTSFICLYPVGRHLCCSRYHAGLYHPSRHWLPFEWSPLVVQSCASHPPVDLISKAPHLRYPKNRHAPILPSTTLH